MKKRMFYFLSLIFIMGVAFVGLNFNANAGYPCPEGKSPKRGNTNWLICTGGGTDCFRCVRTQFEEGS